MLGLIMLHECACYEAAKADALYTFSKKTAAIF